MVTRCPIIANESCRSSTPPTTRETRVENLKRSDRNPGARVASFGVYVYTVQYVFVPQQVKRVDEFRRRHVFDIEGDMRKTRSLLLPYTYLSAQCSLGSIRTPAKTGTFASVIRGGVSLASATKYLLLSAPAATLGRCNNRIYFVEAEG